MAGKATTIDQQIKILTDRGVKINDVDKAKEVLLDIGYYRLGFYFYPFELSYPHLDDKRGHEVIPGTKFEDAVNLYYFDFDLRNILLRYTSRIEVAFRTYVVYYMSNKYSNNPTWFVDRRILNNTFVKDIKEKYTDIQKNPVIERHHKKHACNYAPAWKTLEFVTMGSMQKLFEALKCRDDQVAIIRHFNIRKIGTFISYIDTIRRLRNACAHGTLLYDITLSLPIAGGPAVKGSNPARQRLSGIVDVAKYMLMQISENRANDLWTDLYKCFDDLFKKNPSLKSTVEKTTLIDFEKFLAVNTKNNENTLQNKK